MRRLAVGMAIVVLLSPGCREKRPAQSEGSGPEAPTAEIRKLEAGLESRSWQTRFFSIKALERINEKTSVGALIKALADEDATIRAYAARALGRPGRASAVQPLIESLKAKGGIDYGAVDSALIKIGKAAVPSLIEALGDRHWRVPSTAVRALGEIGDTSAVEPLISILRNKANYSGLTFDATFFLRYNAAEALGRLGDRRALKPLVEALLDEKAREQDEKPWVRCAAAEALGKLADPEAIEPLVTIMKSDRTGGIRFWAADALSRIGEPALAPLRKLLKHEDDALRYWATRALGSIAAPEAVEILEHLNRDKSPWVRRAAQERLKGFPDPRFGLIEEESLSIWGTNGTFKVRKGMPAPLEFKDEISIECAGNEVEPFQIVLSAKSKLESVEILTPDLVSVEGARLSRDHIEVLLEEYVSVQVPSDILGRSGEWPDPLLPYQTPFPLRAGQQQPVWLNVHVPFGTPPGDYTGMLKIVPGSGKPLSIRLRVHVFNFSLPRETHTRTAYGVSLNNKWHGLRTMEEKRRTYDLYMQVFAKHRISPYNPMAFYPIKRKPGQPADTGGVTLDFELFDQGAKKYLDEFGFNSFRFPMDFPFDFSLRDVVDERRRRKLSEEDIADFIDVFRQKTEHLRRNGWLSKAYCYWVDEPPFELFPMVKRGLDFLKKTDPDLKRLLTLHLLEAPHREFFGRVNLWVPELDRLDVKQIAARQKRGEEVWSYICLAPKAPYPNIFIDHPALTHRIRFWMMEKFSIEGDLIWSTNTWNHLSRYEAPADGFWAWAHSNGDGILIYPPAKEPPREPLIAPPVVSIRLELTREGLEDREYFWILRREIDRVRKLSDDRLSGLIDEAESLLTLPEKLVKSFTIYEREPGRLYQVRARLARMIERLTAIKVNRENP